MNRDQFRLPEAPFSKIAPHLPAGAHGSRPSQYSLKRSLMLNLKRPILFPEKRRWLTVKIAKTPIFLAALTLATSPKCPCGITLGAVWHWPPALGGCAGQLGSA